LLKVKVERKSPLGDLGAEEAEKAEEKKLSWQSAVGSHH